jgi:predicted nucleic acid-binding protein
MLANTLKSKKARLASIAVVRAFIALKQFALDYTEISDKLRELENRCNKQFRDVYDAINYLLLKEKNLSAHRQRRPIGYRAGKSDL